MRILFVHTFFYPEIVGGAEYSVKKLAEGLVRSGHEAYVLCSGEENICEEINGVKVYRIKTFIRRCANKKSIITKIEHFSTEMYNLFDRKIICSVLDEIKPDVIHTNCLYQFSTSVWKYASKKHIKIVHTIRDYFLSCYRTSMGCEGCDIPQFICKAYKSINRKSSQCVDIVTAPSEITLQKSLNDGLFSKARSFCIPNAIDFELQDVQKKCITHKERMKAKSTFRILYLGALSERKGVRWLLEVFSELKRSNIELCIAGKGDLLNLVEQTVEREPNISYLGFLGADEVEREIEKSDVLVVPSLWEEPFGRVVLDAYKQGVPVVACRSGGLSDIVVHETTGILVEPNNSKELSEALIKIVDDYVLYGRCCDNIPQKILEYSIDNQVEQFLTLYNE